MTVKARRKAEEIAADEREMNADNNSGPYPPEADPGTVLIVSDLF